MKERGKMFLDRLYLVDLSQGILFMLLFLDQTGCLEVKFFDIYSYLIETPSKSIVKAISKLGKIIKRFLITKACWVLGYSSSLHTSH